MIKLFVYVSLVYVCLFLCALDLEIHGQDPWILPLDLEIQGQGGSLGTRGDPGGGRGARCFAMPLGARGPGGGFENGASRNGAPAPRTVGGAAGAPPAETATPCGGNGPADMAAAAGASGGPLNAG